MRKTPPPERQLSGKKLHELPEDLQQSLPLLVSLRDSGHTYKAVAEELSSRGYVTPGLAQFTRFNVTMLYRLSKLLMLES